MEQKKKTTVVSKGTRLKWESLKRAKPTKLTDAMVVGKKITATELAKNLATATLLVP